MKTNFSNNYSVANVLQKHMNEFFNAPNDYELKNRVLNVLNGDAVGKCPEEARLRAIRTINLNHGSKLRSTITTWILGEKVI